MNTDAYPILEFDPDQEALISPTIQRKKHAMISEKLLICFFSEVMEQLEKEGQTKKIGTLGGENVVDIYQFVDKDITLIPGRLGAPAAAGFLEDFIALGAKKILFCGGAGVLRSDLLVGKFMVVKEAIRDEGTSYHYLPPSREVKAKDEVVEKICAYLEGENVDHLVGKTWTTDAFYRETKGRIKRRREEGALMVEMEQAALLAVSAFRGVSYGAILYGGDDVSKDTWDNRGWRDRKDIRYGLAKITADILDTL